MALRLISINFVAIFLVLLTVQSLPSTALIATPDLNPPYPKAISDLKEAIVKGLGFSSG
ncbi:unnamed protein product [Ilex paraguariensis]|uniref:Uncharacterized protein n=1 Tax=Ilex paraguariensis TaxID=185542 RepID=A0ABC8TAD6_9AQUA